MGMKLVILILFCWRKFSSLDSCSPKKSFCIDINDFYLYGYIFVFIILLSLSLFVRIRELKSER
jgi:hypothetical protein